MRETEREGACDECFSKKGASKVERSDSPSPAEHAVILEFKKVGTEKVRLRNATPSMRLQTNYWHEHWTDASWHHLILWNRYRKHVSHAEFSDSRFLCPLGWCVSKLCHVRLLLKADRTSKCVRCQRFVGWRRKDERNRCNLLSRPLKPSLQSHLAILWMKHPS